MKIYIYYNFYIEKIEKIHDKILIHQNNINSTSKKININNEIKDIIVDHKTPVTFSNIEELADKYESDDKIKSVIEIYINIEKTSEYNPFYLDYAKDLTDELIKLQKEQISDSSFHRLADKINDQVKNTSVYNPFDLDYIKDLVSNLLINYLNQVNTNISSKLICTQKLTDKLLSEINIKSQKDIDEANKLIEQFNEEVSNIKRLDKNSNFAENINKLTDKISILESSINKINMQELKDKLFALELYYSDVCQMSKTFIKTNDKTIDGNINNSDIKEDIITTKDDDDDFLNDENIDNFINSGNSKDDIITLDDDNDDFWE